MSERTAVYIYKLTLHHFLLYDKLHGYDTIYVKNNGRVALLYDIIEKIPVIGVKIKRVLKKKIEVIKSGEDIPNYASISVAADNKATEILLENVDDDGIVDMKNIFDKKGSKSYYTKGTWLYTGLRYFVADLYKLKQDPNQDYKEIAYMPFPNFRTYHIEGFTKIETNRMKQLYIRCIKIRELVKMMPGLLQRLFKNQKKTNETQNHRLLSAEIGNPNYINGKPGQPDYLIDGNQITDSDVIYYKTSHDMIEEASISDYEEFENSVDLFLDLREAPIMFHELIMLIKYYLFSPAQSLSDLHIFKRSVEVFIEFNYIFRNYDISYNVSPSFSNDKRRVRMEGGLITALARKHGVKNIDYQTRPTYVNTLEHMFNYHDILYVWSGDWITDDSLYRLIDEIIIVGNVFTERTDIKPTDKLVSIFTTDITKNGRNTLEYNTRLVEYCMKIAEQYPDYKFILKPKFEDQTDILLSNVGNLPDNMCVREGLYETNELIDSSEIIIAIGFTSPGIDALCREKKAIIYSELSLSNSLLNELGMVCTNEKDLIDMFSDYAEGGHIDREVYESLDPYRDGHARQRITSDLLSRATALKTHSCLASGG